MNRVFAYGMLIAVRYRSIIVVTEVVDSMHHNVRIVSSSPRFFIGVGVTRSLVLCECFVDRCLSFCTFSFGHCAVCSSSIYWFWLPLWYLQTLLSKTMQDQIQLSYLWSFFSSETLMPYVFAIKITGLESLRNNTAVSHTDYNIVGRSPTSFTWDVKYHSKDQNFVHYYVNDASSTVCYSCYWWTHAVINCS
jgi:hypothetical protein